MQNIRITKQFSFETGQALHGYDGKCKNIHGHSYRLDVTVIGKPVADESKPKCGMVIDFSDLKKIAKKYLPEKIINQKKRETCCNPLMSDFFESSLRTSISTLHLCHLSSLTSMA